MYYHAIRSLYKILFQFRCTCIVFKYIRIARSDPVVILLFKIRAKLIFRCNFKVSKKPIYTLMKFTCIYFYYITYNTSIGNN